MALREAEIIEEFSIFEDPMDRYAYLIDVGKKLPELPLALQRDEYLVPGCQSKVWLIGRRKEDRVWFQADSNTAITRGIIALLLRVLSGQPAAAIQRAKLGFLDAIELRSHLSSQRANGLASMILRIKGIAGLDGLETASSDAALPDSSVEPANQSPKQAS
ncbi:MAG: SufE family protein [Bacteroidetes bacterium]|nr:SufE family protein [Bacteroidota bacterium]